ncbi:hypothetical protein CAPTEDRAFT_201010 [Capitella teleta]|uniref:Uncharacterized protein n=1 Tax=Capitella teleta TaxID=283909 RepID=R7UBQ2_CAPTE|nr:hypothetical protein CAPTEDRAFT_201010 [Capitella teleta]|eukprot:ELU03521.1 hypothetical protein CAPTEDRAFT_201010 [Capitella teleta]
MGFNTWSYIYSADRSAIPMMWSDYICIAFSNENTNHPSSAVKLSSFVIKEFGIHNEHCIHNHPHGVEVVSVEEHLTFILVAMEVHLTFILVAIEVHLTVPLSSRGHGGAPHISFRGLEVHLIFLLVAMEVHLTFLRVAMEMHLTFLLVAIEVHLIFFLVATEVHLTFFFLVAMEVLFHTTSEHLKIDILDLDLR